MSSDATKSVVLLCEYGTVSGGEYSMLATLPFLRRAGWKLTAVVPEDGALAQRLQAEQCRTIAWNPSEDGRTRPLEERRRILHDILQVEAGDVNLVHANSLSMSRVSGPVVQELGLPSIGHLRDIVRLNKTVIGDLNRHTRLLAVSEATRAHHVAQGLDPDRSFAMHNGVDLDAFCPRERTGYFHEELGLDSSARLIGVIGQIGLRKGTDSLLEAAAEIVSVHEDVHFLMFGNRWSDKAESIEFEASLRRTSETPPLTEHVHWMGYRPEAARILNELTLVAHAARQEPLGRVLLEAAASGTPVVATDVGGTREIFPEATGVELVPPDDPPAMRDAVLAILDDPSREASLRDAVRRRAIAAFDIKTAASNLLRHYESVAR